MPRLTGLWRHGDFMKLWTGQTVSIFGSSVTTLALPTVAILALHATPFEIGLLMALSRLPFPVLALLAGAWVDRIRRRPPMMAADWGRALALTSIPVAAAFGALTLNQLYAVALISGVFTVLFDVSYLAYVPSLVGRDAVVEGNTKLQFSDSVTNLVGPGIAGLLIQFLGATRAIAVDAGSFAISALSILWIGTPERQLERTGRTGAGDIGDGLRFVFGQPVLRSLILILGTAIFGFHAAEAAQYPFLYQDLHLSPAIVGLIFSAGGIGALGGVFFVSRVISAMGVGRAIGVAGFIQGACVAALTLAVVLPPLPVLVAVLMIQGVLDPIHNVTQQSLRQGLTPDRLQGRMNATFRTVYWGAWPLGNLAGGILATRIGLVETIIVAGVWGALTHLAVFVTPLGRVIEHPQLRADGI